MPRKIEGLLQRGEFPFDGRRLHPIEIALVLVRHDALGYDPIQHRIAEEGLQRLHAGQFPTVIGPSCGMLVDIRSISSATVRCCASGFSKNRSSMIWTSYGNPR